MILQARQLLLLRDYLKNSLQREAQPSNKIPRIYAFGAAL